MSRSNHPDGLANQPLGATGHTPQGFHSWAKKIPEADEFDAADDNSSHFFVMSEKRDAVGTGRIDATGKIAKLAVVADYRDRGAGTAILKRPSKEAGIRGYHHVYWHAQTQARDVDGKFGFSQ